jgi:salicylate hydroxylase
MRASDVRSGLNQSRLSAMAPARHVIVAGAGIAGLSAALTLARAGMRVTVFEQAEKLEEAGAGLQLSPNATRVLIGLGLRERLEAVATKPQGIRVLAGGTGREIARIPLGDDVERRYGAPYLAMHRGDLQSVLMDAAADELDVDVVLGVRVEEFAAHVKGVSVLGKCECHRRTWHRPHRSRRHLVDGSGAVAPAGSADVSSSHRMARACASRCGAA